MKISIFCPTQRPGMDVTHHSIRRQKCDAELQWIFLDELYAERREVFAAITGPDRAAGMYRTYHGWVPKKEGYHRNLAQTYNVAMDVARDWGADLFVSLQDYIYVPEDGIKKFIEMDKFMVHQGVDCLYTGICSISLDPLDDRIHDLNGMYTIFQGSYDRRPEVIDWVDVRFNPNERSAYCEVDTIWFEANWAAIPKKALYDDKLFFDETYDEHVAYENQDFAYRARERGFSVVMDHHNQVISLPHKRYFEAETLADGPHTIPNREKTEARWGTP